MSLKEIRLSSPEDPRANEKVVINVGGIRHETYTTTLKNIPDTRLSWITENKTQLPEYDPNTNEYFFDRHPTVFTQILNFYRTGKLHCPNDVCGPLFEEELAFWGIDELQVESCCWLNYKKHREAQANLDTLDGHDSDRDSLSDMDMTVYGLVADSIRNKNRTLWKKIQPKVWTTFEEPYSSRLAQAIAFTTLILILTSVITFCLESVPFFEDKSSTQYQVLYITDIICVAWFTLEFVMRLTFCPRKLQFIKKPMNWIDFCAIMPFYLDLFISSSNIKTIVVLRVVRLIRVFRIFKLSRHSYGLQILGHTLRSSCSELFLLAFFLSIGVVIFSSIIYYAEKDIRDTKFTTIPASFWWAVVTMTTLGYGDMAPESWEGKIVGSFCAISGVLMIALPVPVIVSNFSLYYSHAKARLKLPKRKRPLVIGAANALKVAQSFVTQSSPKISKEMVADHIESEDQDDSEKDDSLPGSRNRWSSPYPSIRSTPRATPMERRRLPSANTVVIPSSPRNSLPTLGQEVKRGSLFAVPEAERIEIEMVECNPSCSVIVENIPTNVSTKESVSQQSSPSALNSTFRSSEKVSEVSSAATALSPKRSDTESGSSVVEMKTPPSSRQRSTSSNQSMSIDSTQGSPKLNPRGRMGRRGSLYVVGFTAKHWQNKALKKNKKTQSAQTDTGSRKPSATSTADRTSSATQAGIATSGRRSSGKTPDDSGLSSPEKESQLHSQLTASRESGTATQTEEGRPLAQNGLRDIHDGHGYHGVDERNSKSVHTSKRSRSEPHDSSRFKALPVNRLRDEYQNGKSTGVSVSIESNDSSARLSDDSLTISDRHRQRRGSSPLVRQKAVFTFDMPDQLVQVDPSAGGRLAASKRKSTPSRAHDDNGFSLSPLIEHSESDLAEPRKLMETRRNSCIPAITTERKSSNKGKKSKSSGIIPNGYVNGSYHFDEDDRRLSERRLSSGTQNSGISSAKELFLDPGLNRSRSETYPAYFALGPEAHPSITLSSHGEPFYTEAKSFGHYSALDHRQISSNSDSNLPSISEELAGFNSKQRGVDMACLETPGMLPRPNSLPNAWSGNLVRPVVMHRPHSDSVYFNHTDAYHFPSEVGSSMGNLRQPAGILRFPAANVSQSDRKGQPVRRHTYGSFEEQKLIRDQEMESLLAQRRQGRVLYVHVPQSETTSRTTTDHGEHGDRMTEVSRYEMSQSKNNACEHVGSPFFKKTESVSSPDLLSMKGTLPPGRLSSNLSNSWYQSANEPPRTLNGFDGIFSDYPNYPSHPSGGALSTCSVSVHSVPNSVQNVSVKHFVDESIAAGLPSTSRSSGEEAARVQSASSPALERTDGEVMFNGHETLQKRDSSSRPASVPVFNRQRARAIFVGDSGIDSVGSLTSMTHSLEAEVESVTCPSNSRVDILNPIHENDTEISDSSQAENARNTGTAVSVQSANEDHEKTKKKQLVMSNVKLNGNRMSDILGNSDLYESSLV